MAMIVAIAWIDCSQLRTGRQAPKEAQVNDQFDLPQETECADDETVQDDLDYLAEREELEAEAAEAAEAAFEMYYDSDEYLRGEQQQDLIDLYRNE